MAPLAFHFTHYRSLPMNHPAAARIFAGLLALAFAGHAAADARSEVHAAFLKNLGAKAYRSTITDLATGQQVSTVEFQAPDRYRISANGMNSVIANGKMYMTVNGKAMAMALPPGTLEKFRSDAAWKQMESETLISNAGAGVIGGEPALKYHWITSGKHPSTGDVWVSRKTGYVVQVETSEAKGSKMGAVRVAYGAFDSGAIRIAPPKQ
jgi:outer membrane lipoprotein-sorting protein